MENTEQYEEIYDGNIRVITYNVLSAELCDETEFNHSIGFCDPELRLQSIFKKLEPEIWKYTIFGFQEVCREWAGKFQAFFAQWEYTFIYGSDSGPHNGFMGTALAFPNTFEMLDCKYLSPFHETFEEIKRPKARGVVDLVGGAAFCLAVLYSNNHKHATGACLSLLTLLGIQRYYEHQNYRKFYDFKFEQLGPDGIRIGVQTRKGDMLLMCKIQDKEQRKPFWIATTHAPCKYWNNSLMLTFAAKLAQAVQETADEDPYLFFGDFNFHPDSDSYKLYSRGAIHRSKIDINGWKPEVDSMRSAYKISDEMEPEFTTYVRSKRGGTFQSTLDYIWMSDRWFVKEVLPIPRVSKDVQSWPCETEPSDHCMIGATLELLVDDDTTDAE